MKIDTVLKEKYGDAVQIVGSTRSFGGDISNAFAIALSNGENVFCKTNSVSRASMFEVEAAGLSMIAVMKTIQTPEVYGFGIDEERNCSYILMQNLGKSPKRDDFWDKFGRELAMMHMADTSWVLPKRRCGLEGDGYIGNSVQLNTPCDSWIQFFRDCRLEPQIRMASIYFDSAILQRFDILLSRLDGLLIEPDRPSLLHGDLWGGNYMTGPDGYAWLIDPAVYIGHREADIAMTELFGGFTERFYESYVETAPLQPGYSDRRDLYNLYHLLNHLNLFGAGYLGFVVSVVRKYE